eukprot:CAMPEP_0114555620 /NCGR_PEP_ID=MMETSP0114-20121206/8849_1 /TAXON_ID=31324 /ORGANISM="Goniomonas sp, Strain m" /LENGTH=369 /DNA_ID=CAMNT_0001740763 /DNA_START=34 /DNA_END=1143 /DNA_ORIENTATION=+
MAEMTAGTTEPVFPVTVYTWLSNCADFLATPKSTIGSLKVALERELGTRVSEQVMLGRLASRQEENSPLVEFDDDCGVSSILANEDGTVELVVELSVDCLRQTRCFIAPDGDSCATRFAHAPPHASVLILDYDDTLAKNGAVSDETVSTLLELKKQGHLLSVASFNLSVPELLRLRGLSSIFDIIVCGTKMSGSKEGFVTTILGLYEFQAGASSRRVYFFDDQASNIDAVQGIVGVETVHVSSPDNLCSVLRTKLINLGKVAPVQVAIPEANSASPEPSSPKPGSSLTGSLTRCVDSLSSASTPAFFDGTNWAGHETQSPISSGSGTAAQPPAPAQPGDFSPPPRSKHIGRKMKGLFSRLRNVVSRDPS